jgi:hypothetical protein
MMGSTRLRLLFVGESWFGSSATSLKEALRRIEGVIVEEVNEDSYYPRADGIPVRIAKRVLGPLFTAEFKRAILKKCIGRNFDAVLVYKLPRIDAEFVRKLKRHARLTVNIFPDYSPFVYGSTLREAMGTYDLVVSVKRFHPALWNTLYKYTNECAHVPHGYNPLLHLVKEPPASPTADVVMVATWRAEYEELLLAMAGKLEEEGVSLVLAGAGWEGHRDKLPASWRVLPSQHGIAYIETLRSGRIVIAPLHQRIHKDAPQHQGDEDTGRSYELAAAHCFFIHQRTEFIKTQYDEQTEVPMFDGPDQLLSLILKYRNDAEARLRFATAAHRRAVPAYSRDARAAQTVAIIEKALARKAHAGNECSGSR